MKKQESFIEKSFCLCVINVPSTWYQLRMLELQRMLSAWFDMVIRQIWFFLFFGTSVRCLFVFNPGSFTTRKVVFEVCSYYQSVYIPCKGSIDVQKRRQTSWSRLFERWMARSKLSAALLQRRRPRELAVQATIQLISVRETNCVIHWIEILCPPLYKVARSPLGGGTTGTR